MNPAPIQEQNLLAALRQAEDAYQECPSQFNRNRVQSANAAYIDELNKNLHSEAKANEHKERLIPHRVIEVAAGIIWITVMLFVCLSACTRPHGVSYTTSDGRFDVWEGKKGIIDMVRCSDRKGYRDRLDKLPASYQQAFLRDKLRKLERSASR
jgi:hypothetical protein